MRLIPVVEKAVKTWQKRAELTYMERAYLIDLSQGREYSLDYSPFAIKKILTRLIETRCAAPYDVVNGTMMS